MDKEANHKQVDLEPIRHVYVHIPFCARICPYCAFYKELADPRQTDRFCQAIAAEIRSQAEAFKIVPETIFFGGGTPTALATRQLDLLLRAFRERLDLSHLREWTIEANPGSVSARKAEILRGAGVSRISLGVQSWDDDLLQLLGREHTADQAEASFQLLREAGFKNISIDLMFGLPNQSIEQWRTTLRKTIDLRPDHISAYCLTYEEHTDFFLRHSRGELRSDNDSDAEFFEVAMASLESAGYHHYEISNYALPGFASAHNRGYWEGADYLGFGPSAFSTVGMSRWQNVCDYRAYSDRILSGQSPVHFVEELSPAMKVAMTLDGRIAPPAGIHQTREPYWITGEAARASGRRTVHRVQQPLVGAERPMRPERVVQRRELKRR
jgi:oxygen-independent coproporphyrinogen-3 oxidase